MPIGLYAWSPGVPAKTARPRSTSTSANCSDTAMPGRRPDAIRARSWPRPSWPAPTSCTRLIPMLVRGDDTRYDPPQMSRRTLLVLVLLAAASTASAATPPQRYHLELEANPAAPFPYLSKFGTDIEVHVYPSGVRLEALWLNSFSRNGASAVSVANPL